MICYADDPVGNSEESGKIQTREKIGKVHNLIIIIIIYNNAHGGGSCQL